MEVVDTEREFALLAETEEARFAAAAEVMAAQGGPEPITTIDNGPWATELRHLLRATAPRNDAEMLAWFLSGPARTINNGDWNGGCEAAVVNAGQLIPYSSAMLAGNASGPLDPSPASAQGAEFSFWAGVGGLGHVVNHDPRDPRFILGASATMAALGQQLGHNLARCLISDYQRVTGLPYRGHSPRHGTQTLAHTIPAGGGGVTPLTNGDDMTLILQSTGRGQWLVAPGYGHHLNPEESGQIVGNRDTLGITLYDCGSNDRAFDVIYSAMTQTGVPVTLLDAASIQSLANEIGGEIKVTPTDLTPVLSAITELDKQDDTYQAQLTAILAKGLTGTVTVVPAK